MFSSIPEMSMFAYTAEELSRFIHRGMGSQSMERAAAACSTLNKELTQIEQQEREVSAQLRSQWRSPAHGAWTAKIEQFCHQLSDNATKAHRLGKGLTQAKDAYDAALRRMPSPETLEANRKDVKRLKDNNYSGKHIVAITELDSVYANMQSAAYEAMTDYYLTVETVAQTVLGEDLAVRLEGPLTEAAIRSQQEQARQERGMLEQDFLEQTRLAAHPPKRATPH